MGGCRAERPRRFRPAAGPPRAGSAGRVPTTPRREPARTTCRRTVSSLFSDYATTAHDAREPPRGRALRHLRPERPAAERRRRRRRPGLRRAGRRRGGYRGRLLRAARLRAPSGPDTGGPDARPDLYVSRFAAGTFGVAFPEDEADGGAFVAVANSLDPSPAEALGSLYGTVAHELFHLVQFSYFGGRGVALPGLGARGHRRRDGAARAPEIADIVSTLQLRRWFAAPHRSHHRRRATARSSSGRTSTGATRGSCPASSRGSRRGPCAAKGRRELVATFRPRRRQAARTRLPRVRAGGGRRARHRAQARAEHRRQARRGRPCHRSRSTTSGCALRRGGAAAAVRVRPGANGLPRHARLRARERNRRRADRDRARATSCARRRDDRLPNPRGGAAQPALHASASRRSRTAAPSRRRLPAQRVRELARRAAPPRGSRGGRRPRRRAEPGRPPPRRGRAPAGRSAASSHASTCMRDSSTASSCSRRRVEQSLGLGRTGRLARRFRRAARATRRRPRSRAASSPPPRV